MYRVIFGTLMLVSLFFSFQLSGQGPGERNLDERKEAFIKMHGDLPITGFTITGLERTRESLIRSFLNARAGDRLSTFDSLGFEQKIYELGIIRNVSIEYESVGDGAEVFIDLDEKWTLIGFPFFMSTDDGYTFGLFAIESNLFGLNKQLVVGGFYGSSGWNVLTMYTEPGTGDYDFIYKASLFVGDNEVENHDIYGGKYQAYKAFTQSYGFSPGYHLGPFKAYLDLDYRRYSVDSDYDKGRAAPLSDQFPAAGVTLEYKDQQYVDFRMKGTTVSGEYSHIYSVSDGSHWDTGAVAFNYTFIPVWRCFVTANMSGGYGNVPDLLKTRVAGKSSFQSLRSGNIGTSEYGGTSLTGEVPLYSNNTLVCSLTTFGEGGILSLEEDWDTSYLGAGGGLKLYLKGVAIPAIGLVGAYNFEAEEYVYTFSIGMK